MPVHGEFAPNAPPSELILQAQELSESVVRPIPGSCKLHVTGSLFPPPVAASRHRRCQYPEVHDAPFIRDLSERIVFWDNRAVTATMKERANGKYLLTLEAGIDPYNKLVDRDSDDNRKKVTVQ